MTFLMRLAAEEPFDTWPGMELAAVERYWDGFVLATSELRRNTGAIYSFGYVAEMLLKAAYFRFIGVVDTQDLGNGPLREVRAQVEWRGRNLHDLQAWASLLILRREALGRPLDPAVAGQALWHALTVDEHWRETIRYKYTAASDEELQEVHDGVEWLIAHYNLLWS